MRINLNDERYKRMRYQEFGSFEEACIFLRDYCGDCRLEDKCEISEDLRTALREDCPFWDENLVRQEAKSEYNGKIFEPEKEGLLKDIVVCKLFEERK